MYPFAPTRNSALSRPFASIANFSSNGSLGLLKACLTLFTIFQMMNSLAQAPAASHSAPVVAVTFDATKSASPLDGRLLLMLSTDPAEEPRLQISDGLKTQIIFGMDVENWKAGEPRIFEASAEIFGHPLRNLRDLKAGEYTLQALLDRYETFHRSDGRVLKLPNDRGEGRKWNRAPGNLYSKPEKVRLDGGKQDRIDRKSVV